MMKAQITTFALVLLTASSTLATAPALAGGFGNRLQSAVGTGAAFAGAGTMPYGLSGMFWNPAAVNLADGFMTDSNYTLVLPQSEITATDGTSPALLGLGATSGNIGIDALVPGSYLAYRLAPDWAIGLSVNAPFGLATKADPPWAGQNLAITSKAAVIDVAAVLGYAVNDWLSIAAGPRLVYGKARFTRDIVPPLAAGDGSIQYGILSGLDDYGWGFTAGLTLRPWSGGEIGIGYRSSVDLTLEGEAQLPGPPVTPITRTDVAGDVTLPDQLTVSLAQRLMESWTLLATVEWKNWSRVQDVPFMAQGGPADGAEITSLTFRYRDGWLFALGAEHQWNDRLTLRGGVAYEISPVTDKNRGTPIPDSERLWVSAGATYAVTDRWSVTAGYSHAFLDKASIRVGEGTDHPDSGSIPGLRFVGDVDASIDIVSVGFTYKFGGSAVAAMPEAVITK
jgi:long-chain fatty acid transport protein